MLNRVQHLHGCAVHASDGAIGRVRDAFFDDIRWTIRYLVVDTSKWMSGRDVLISPHAVAQPLSMAKHIEVLLTRTQVIHSPEVDTREPVSRQTEVDVLAYYGHPSYWRAGSLWATGDYPSASRTPKAVDGPVIEPAAGAPIAEGSLRSCAHVKGCAIHAGDGSIGRVDDFVFDDESWAIRYFVVDTRTWWPGGTKVLIATHWIDRIDWDARGVHVNLTLEQVRTSPVYDEDSPVHRDYEERLHSAYDRTGYWD